MEPLEDRAVPSFLAPVTYGSLGQTTWAVESGDFNRDGAQDLVTADTIGHGVKLLLGHGDGTFRPPVTLDAGLGPFKLAVGDFNGDGAPDLAATNADIERFYLEDVPVPPGGLPQSVSVLLGHGDGTFRPRTAYALGFEPGSVLTADFNRDGRGDLVVTSDRTGKVSVLLSNGDTFRTPTVSTLPNARTIYGLTAGDVNRDGVLDLVATATTTSASGSVLYVLRGRSTGDFQTPTTTAIATAYSLSLIDHDRDGRLDAVLGGSSGLRLMRGHGDGTFRAPTHLTTQASSGTFADVNGDGILDLVELRYPRIVRVLLGNANGTFRPPVEIRLSPDDSGTLLVRDLNGDGRPDVVVTSEWSAAVSVLLNDGIW